jgi:hypothetical protein
MCDLYAIDDTIKTELLLWSLLRRGGRMMRETPYHSVIATHLTTIEANSIMKNIRRQGGHPFIDAEDPTEVLIRW